MKRRVIFTNARSEIEYVIDQYILNERNRKIATQRFIDGYTIEKIAENFEMSDRGIKNILRKCEDILVEHLKK